MTCRDEILDAARSLVAAKRQNIFTLDDDIREMKRRKTQYMESTNRTHVSSRMCSNAPIHHAVKYDVLVRISRGQYKLSPRHLSRP